ncbi:MAG: hypothetical protein KAR42_14890 [candidate division Zixibacteria bacterium]|nr:hypothetical protein [candidate division Zixibacteria bacterium]
MTISNIATSNTPKVYVGDTLDVLVYNSRILCNSVNSRIAPQISSASFSHKYGFIKNHDETKFQQTDTLDLRGKFCKVTLPDADGVETDIFYGQVVPQIDVPLGTYLNIDEEVPTGNNAYTAFGLDYLLDRVFIDETHVKDYGIVKRLYSFNGKGPHLHKNRSAAKIGDSYVFEYSDSSENWTALDILEYLLVKFSANTGLTWNATGVFSYLKHTKPNLNPTGKTMRMCLNEIIQPSQGFSYKIWVSEANTAVIEILSITDTDITLDAETLVPASTLTTSISSAIESSRNAENVQIAQVEESAYSFIRVYSEPIRVMATLKLGTDAGGLNIDWSGANETAYGTATDFERLDDSLEKVYTAYRLSFDYDKNDYLGGGIVPFVNESDLSITYNAANPWIYPANPFERSLIVKKNPTDPDPNSDYKPSMLFVKEGSDYYIADKSAFDGNNERPSISLNMADDGPGIYAKPPYNHLLGKNHFAGDSAYGDIYDYEESLLTTSFYTDAILAFKVPGVTVAGESRTKDIYIPGLHYWVAAPSTKIDRDTNTAGVWTAYRDDREQIKKIANIAKAWYGRLRNTVVFSSKQVFAYSQLGYVATTVYTGGSFSPVGTVISSIDYFFGPAGQRVTIVTDFKDLDFAKLSARSMQTSKKALANRIARLEERIKDIPVRISRAAGSGGGSEKFAVIKSGSGLSYVVDIYSSFAADMSFTAITPDEADATAKVPDGMLDGAFFSLTAGEVYMVSKAPVDGTSTWIIKTRSGIS